MSYFKFVCEIRGGHTHIALFAGKSIEHTLAKCGELCMTNQEFKDFSKMTRRAEIYFLEKMARRTIKCDVCRVESWFPVPPRCLRDDCPRRMTAEEFNTAFQEKSDG
jgi:hypothetical protein